MASGGAELTCYQRPDDAARGKRPGGYIDVHNCQVAPTAGHHTEKPGFHFKIVNSQGTREFHAESEDERVHWISWILEASSR
jgi:hypothetical protein